MSDGAKEVAGKLPVEQPKRPLVDDKGRLNVEVKGHPKRKLYWGDLFHTLLPSRRFTAVLFVTYSVLFISFGIPYYYDAKAREWCLQAQNNNCIPGVTSFLHAVWFRYKYLTNYGSWELVGSVQTSMTIGYGGELTPDPDCTLTNVFVAFQSVVSLLVAYSLLGVVYARFSRPTRRASTLVFSHNMVMHEENGVAKLSFRVANIRKHQVIEAHVRMLLALNSVWTCENEAIFRFTSLPVLGGSQIFLGLPCIVSHPVNSNSPLYGLSYSMMQRCDMEILVLLEGVDASTSSKLQARHSYRPSDIRHNHRFGTMVTRSSTGRRKVDFTCFHNVVPVLSAPNHIPPLAPFPRPPLHETRRSSNHSIPPHIPPILQVPRPLPCHPVVAPVSQTSSSSSQPSLPPLIPPILQPPTALPPDRATAESPLIPSGDGNPRSIFENITENVTGGFKGSGSDSEPHFPVRNHIIKALKSRRRNDSFALRSRRRTESVEVEHLNDEDLEAWEGREEGFKRQIADMEEQFERWRQLVVELATRVQQSSILQSPDAESHSLLESSKKALQQALLDTL